MTVLVVGDTEAARRVCHALDNSGSDVVHLPSPTEGELVASLAGNPTAVAIVVRGDVVALRYALLVEHASPGIRLLVTLFDRTVGAQLKAAVPHCEVTSPADISVPSIVGACMGDGVLAIEARGERVRVVVADGGVLQETSWDPPRPSAGSVGRLLLGQFRAHDTTSRVLLAGALGIVAVLLADWLTGVFALHEPAVRAVYNAVRVVATVGPGDTGGRVPVWYLALSSAFMLLTIGFTALLTAGLVNRLLSPRAIAIVGRRTMPTRGHVVVIGLGQVGLRLCAQLRGLGIPVVAVERDPLAVNLRLAKSYGVPVLIAHAEDRAVLEKLSLPSARALAAMGSEDLDNIEVAIAALAVAPDLKIVLRAGDSGIAAETRSLFRIGDVRDVSAATALAIARRVLDVPSGIVVTVGHAVRCFTGTDSAPEPVLAVHTGCVHRIGRQ